MPPIRRRGAATGAGAHSNRSSQQSTLSFGTNKTRITKPSTEPSSTTKKLKSVEVTEPTPVSSITSEKESDKQEEEEEKEEEEEEEEDRDLDPGLDPVTIHERKKEVRQPLSEEEKEAEGITDKDLRSYWIKEEQNRNVRRG